MRQTRCFDRGGTRRDRCAWSSEKTNIFAEDILVFRFCCHSPAQTSTTIETARLLIDASLTRTKKNSRRRWPPILNSSRPFRFGRGGFGGGRRHDEAVTDVERFVHPRAFIPKPIYALWK